MRRALSNCLLPHRAPTLLALTILSTACAGSDGLEPPLPPHSVSVTPETRTFDALGDTARLVAQVKDINGRVLTGHAITWTRRGSGATQLRDSGLVMAIANGLDTVVATSAGLAGVAAFTVRQLPASVSMTSTTPSQITVLGAQLQLRVTALDARSRLIADLPLVWRSSDAGVAHVSPSGIVTAVSPGSAEISASFGASVGASAAVTRPVAVTLTSPVGGPLIGAAIPCTGMAGPFPCDRVDLLSFLPVSGVGGNANVDLNDLWGWTDPLSNREYAIVMRRDGAAFVDVSDPVNPAYLGHLPITSGATANIWHDVKVYANHAFIVADAAGAHGMQVFDLRQLRAHAGVPRTFAPTTTYRQVNSAHNIAINEATGFAYIVGASGGGNTCGGGLHMVDIRVPAAPSFAGCFADPFTGRLSTGYTHDVQCVRYTGPDAAFRDREVCFGSNETHLSIADVSDKSAPVAIGRASYPQSAYTHQGWLTEDQRYFLVNDELDESRFALSGTRTLIWDVQELDDPVLVGEYLGPNPATDHNHYIVGTRMYASTYQFGLRIVDVSNPLQPVAAGYFDTAPNWPNAPGFGGSWSNYPFFRSGIIVMTSRTEGFFVLRAR